LLAVSHADLSFESK